jgi:hypothetical protein
VLLIPESLTKSVAPDHHLFFTPNLYHHSLYSLAKLEPAIKHLATDFFLAKQPSFASTSRYSLLFPLLPAIAILTHSESHAHHNIVHHGHR